MLYSKAMCPNSKATQVFTSLYSLETALLHKTSEGGQKGEHFASSQKAVRNCLTSNVLIVELRHGNYLNGVICVRAKWAQIKLYFAEISRRVNYSLKCYCSFQRATS